MPKYAILAEGAFDYILSKTGNAIIRYRPEEVVCVVDSKSTAKTATEVLGIGDDIPVVASLQDALQYDPNAVLIGTAPPGGQLPQSWREMILMAIENRLDVVAGLHSFLSDDIEFNDLASKKRCAYLGSAQAARSTAILQRFVANT